MLYTSGEKFKFNFSCVVRHTPLHLVIGYHISDKKSNLFLEVL